MQIKKRYSGSAHRKLLPESIDFAGSRGDNLSTTLLFDIPRQYDEYTVYIRFYVLLDGKDGRYTPFYRIENKTFTIPIEITSYGKNVIPYRLEFRKDTEDGEDTIVEASIVNHIAFASTPEMEEAEYSDEDVYSVILRTAFTNGKYNLNPDTDRPEIIFSTHGNYQYTLPLEMPFLEEGKVPRRLLDDDYVIDLFYIQDDEELTTLEEADVGDFVINEVNGNIFICVKSEVFGDWYRIYSPNPTYDSITINGKTDLKSDLDVDGDVQISGDLLVDGSINTVIDVHASRNLSSGEDTAVGKDLWVGGDAVIEGNTSVHGDLRVDGSIDTVIDVHASRDLSSGRNVIVGENLDVGADTNIDGDLDVDGSGYIGGDLRVDGSINTVIDVKAQNNLEATNDLIAGRDLDVGGDGQITGSLEIGENAYLRSELDVDGNVRIGTDIEKSDLSINGNAEISDNISVGGDIKTSLAKDRVIVTDSKGKLDVSDVSKSEVNSLTGIQGNVQSQLNTKEAWENKTSEWGDIPNDVKYPTEKLVKDTFDEVDSRDSAQDSRMDDIDTTISTLDSTLSEDIKDLDEELSGRMDSIDLRDDDQDARMSGIDTRIDGVDFRDSAQEARMTSIEAKDIAQDSRMDDIDTTISTLDSTLSEDIKDLDEELSERMDGIDTRDDGQDSRMDGIDSTISALDTTMSGNIEDLEDSMSERMDGIDARDTAQDTRMDNMDKRMGDIDTRDSAQESRMDGIDAVDVAQNLRMDGIDARMTIIEGVDTAQNTRMDGIDDRIDDVDTKDIAQDDRMSVIEAKDIEQDERLDSIERLDINQDARMSEMDVRMDGIDARDDGQDARMTIIEGVDTSQNTRMDGIDARDDGQDARMTVIEGVDTAQNTRMDSIDVRIDGIDINIGDIENSLDDHSKDYTNPHRITAKQVGLDKVDNTEDINKPISNATQTALDTKLNSSVFDEFYSDLTDVISDIDDEIDTVDVKIDTHIDDTKNPHGVTATQVGLGKVDNTSDADKPISTSTQTALNTKVTKNNDITSGTKTKITYDKKGLVTGGEDLIASDIPALPTSKITGLDTKITGIKSDIQDIENDISGLDTRMGSAEDNITTIYGDIDDIDGDITTINTMLATKVDKNADITTGTKPKITYDKKGLVTGGEDLIASDIPNLNANKITAGTLGADRIPSLAISKIISLDTTITGINTAIDTKVTRNDDITAGTKPKITYDKKGLVTGGADLVASDIPNLNANKITAGTLGADRIPVLNTSKITGLDATLTNIATDISGINTNLDTKVDKNNNITPGTKCKITYDAKGLVTKGADLVATDIPALATSKITGLDTAIIGINTSIDTIQSDISGLTSDKADDNTVVHITGNEDVSGIKTFTSGIKVGTKTSPKEAVINGTLNVEGDIVQNGESYITHAERIETESDFITMRKGAVSGISTGKTSGFKFEKYNGTNDGELGIDSTGTVMVGKTGDLQPLLTRKSKEDMTDNQPIVWSATNKRGETRALVANDIPALPTSKITSLDTALTGINTAIGTKVTANTTITGATKTKITYDSKGLVTDGTDLTATDIPNLNASKITAGTLGVDRIPALATSKITGLDTTLTGINTAIGTKVTANTAITGSTKPKITYDSKGLVTGGANLTDSDIPSTIERNANKKSSWQTTPTDTAYPTEKLVKASLDAKADTTSLTAHTGNTSNPHSVTKAQIGLDKVDNVKQYSASNEPPYPVTKVAGKTGAVTLVKGDVGLGNVDNTSDVNKPISTATQTALNGKVDTNTAITGATKCKITYDAKGLVTKGADLVATDIPALATSKITGLDTALSGLNADISGINSSVGVIQGDISNINTAISTKVTANDNITAGTKCKITYDKKGLVTAGADLTATDIPNLNASKIATGTLDVDRIPALGTSKITGLDTKITGLNADISGLDSRLGGVVKDVWFNIPSAGKIEFWTERENGEETEKLTISKNAFGLSDVDNTSDKNKPISTATQTALNGKVDTNTSITAGTKCKITYDAKGLVTKGADLVATDIPALSTSKITGLDTALSGLNADISGINSSVGVIQGDISNINTAISTKVTANDNITAGTKCKITYDKKGLVIAGADLVAGDIPNLNASKITTGTLGVDRIPALATSKITGLDAKLSGIDGDITSLNTSVGTKVTANTSITAGTKCKITYDANGLVTKGADLTATDIPNLNANKITAGTLSTDRIPALDTSKITGLDTKITSIDTKIENIETNYVTTDTTQTITGVKTIDSSSIGLYSRRRNDKAGIYPGLMMERDTVASGTTAPETYGIGAYFKAKRKSDGAMTHAGLFGGRLVPPASGDGTQQVGEVVLSPAWQGTDPYPRADMRIRATGSGSADVHLTGDYYANATTSGKTGKKLSTVEYVDGQVGAVGSDVSGLTTRVNTAEGKITVNEGLIGVNAGAISGLDSRLGGVVKEVQVAPSDNGLVIWTELENGEETGKLPIDKGTFGLSKVDNTSDLSKPISTATQTALNNKVDKNTAITGATKTKITYDAKGLVTAGTDAGILDITGLTDALDGKFDKSGGTINGNTTVNGGMTASGLIRGKQAEKMGDAVMLGDDGLVPTRFLREDKFTFGVSFDSEIFETDDEGCLSYSMDATGMIPVTNKNNVLDIGSFNFNSNILLRDCFYATFGTDGKIRHKLNPENLTESIDGEDMSVEITQYNTMFCIPTLYFKSGDNYAWLSNDSTKGTPFFHTLDDKVYDYYAIGVYEGFVRDGKLMSVAGVYPTARVTRPNFRTYAQANGTNWHLVNWHGRQLIRLLTIFSLKRFNSQDGIGNGFVVGGNTTTNPEGALTGSLNTSGAFAGDTLQSSNPVKALIENPWGSKWEFIDDFVVDTGYTIGDDSFIDIYAGQNSLADDDLIASKDRIATVQVQRVDGAYNTFCTKINTDDVAWGLFDNDAGSATTGLCDIHWVNGSAQRLGLAGGGSNSGSEAGVSALHLSNSLSHSSWLIGARLAFHFNG